MSVRSRDGDSVTLTSPELAATFTAAAPRVVVLVHGLGQTESCWLGDGSKRPFGLWDRLDSDPSLTAVVVRYNSGRRVSENGADLAVLLEELTLAWPVPIESIALVGSSMGGLLVRSACQSGLVAGSEWVDAVTHVVTLASPHLGAPLEKAAHIASWGLRVAPQSRPLADFLDTRSSGIKDLRFGSIVGEDREDVDRYSPVSVDKFEILEGADHLFVAAVVTSDPGHPLGVLFGDLMVRPGSGTGRGRQRRIEAKEVRVLGGLRHSGLIHDANLQNLVIEWLTPTPEKPAAVGFS
jgi:triacylglycerol esterase/lipase EstA (alpha/beta hydrolase family)